MSETNHDNTKLYYLLGQMRALIGAMYSDIEAEGARTIEHKEAILVIDHVIARLVYPEMKND